MGKHTNDELRLWQALPLGVKIGMTQNRIRDWVNEYGEDGVYVSFSGGKDSAVLSHLVDLTYPGNEIPRVFADTGLEYPEIRAFVKREPRAVFVKPKMNFRKVIEKYGYPFINKEVGECVYGAKKYLDELLNRQTDRQTDSITFLTRNSIEKLADAESMRNRTRGGETPSIENSEELANLLNKKMHSGQGGANYRTARMLGMLDKQNQVRTAENIPEKDRSMFAQTRWRFFLEPGAPPISSLCCNVMKKAPMHKYQHETGRNPMTAEMASESRLRRQKWLQFGCNMYSAKNPKSTPMAFWTEQDVLQYIHKYGIEICSVYGDVVPVENECNQVPGQMRLNLDGTIEEAECKLKTTGCSRTGCMFCGFGCHLEKPGEGRFERMKVTHPKLYEYLMRPWEEAIEVEIPDKRYKSGKRIEKRVRKGLNYKEVIDWINENGGTKIRY